MNLRQLTTELGMVCLTPSLVDDEGPVTSGYASDLLSDVLAHAPSGALLVTAQAHLNVIAVASHVGLRAVIFTGSVAPGPEVLSRAADEGILSYRATCPSFDVVGRLYALGLRGDER